MNVTVLTSDSFDGIKEKMKAHLHALTSLEFEQVKEPF
jgi:hypothetical protein